MVRPVQKKTTNLNAIVYYDDRAASSGVAFEMDFSCEPTTSNDDKTY